MAREFPHAAVTAVDLAPVPIDAASLPSNVQFEIDDVNKGLEHFKDMFDLVHIRLVGSGLQNFAKTMQDVEECLKPGGIALFMDVDYDMYSEDQRVYIPFALEDDDVECERSWFQRIVYEMRRGAMSSGKSDIYGMSKAMDEGLWEHPLMDPETCKTGSLYMPIGPWAEASNHIAAQQLKYVGALMRQDLMSAHRAGHAVMKRIGWPPETLAKWSSKADEQMMKTNPRTWIRMRYAWGRRRAGENQPAPALATPPGIHADDPEVPYPHFYVYGSKEESLAETKLRNRGKDLPVPPLPIASVTPTPAQT
ncbi:hypothetical protein FRC16_000605 [Serendipita sp. 398]|nr:hypothetical protein FRC16_000605 [Serendipita sp. 398]